MLVKMETGASGGGSVSLIAWAKGESITENKDNDSNYCSVAQSGGGSTAQHIITFNKACSGYFGVANNLTVTATATITAISSYATYTDKLYSFEANANDTITMKQRDWYAGYEIIGS